MARTKDQIEAFYYIKLKFFQESVRQSNNLVQMTTYNDATKWISDIAQEYLQWGMALARHKKDYQGTLQLWAAAPSLVEPFRVIWERTDRSELTFLKLTYRLRYFYYLLVLSGNRARIPELLDFVESFLPWIPPEATTHLLPGSPMSLFLGGQADRAQQYLGPAYTYISKYPKDQNTTQDTPYLEGYQEVENGNREGLEKALEQAQVNMKLYRRKSLGAFIYGAGNYNDIVLDLDGLVLAVHAASRGLEVSTDSVYFPQEFYRMLVDQDRKNSGLI